MLYEMTIDANRPSRHSLEININIGLKSLFTYSIWELKFQTTVISMHAKTIRHNKKGSAASTTSQDGLQDAPCVLYRFLKWATPVVHHTLDTPPRTIIYFWMSTIQFLAFNSDDRHVYIGLFELTNDVLAISEYCKQATVKVLLAVFGNISNEKALSIVTYSHWQIKTFITNHVLFLIQTTSEAFTPKAVSPGAPREVQMPRRYSWIALLKIYVLQEYWSSFYPIKRYRCKILQGISISDIPVLVDCFPLILIESILYGE